jgi:hypothetical protein
VTSDQTGLSAPRLVGGPAAWRGSEIQTPHTYTYELTRVDAQELDAALRHAVSQDLNPPEIGSSQFRLRHFGVSLKALGRQLETGIGFCLIRGVPIERYSVAEAGIVLCGIGAHLGRQMPQNAKGDVINHVRDAGLAAAPGAPVRGYQSGLALPFHSDSCDIVGLLCICDAKSGGVSAIASSYAIHDALYSEQPALLRSLYEAFHIDRHGDNPHGTPPYYSTPVFMWHDDRLFSRFNPGYVYSAQRYAETPRLTQQQADALELFERLCASDRFRLEMNLRPGDLQLLNNNVVVHSRSAYQDDVEAAKKRHLLRLWLFTRPLNGIPLAMRDRYRDMEAWQANAQPRKQSV